MANPAQQSLFINEKINQVTFCLSLHMKHVKIFLFLFWHNFVFAQSVVIKPDRVFQPGEELNYRFEYGFFTVAKATFKVFETDVKFDNKPTYLLKAEAKTSGAFDIIYKVRDYYDSYIDQTSLLPYLYQENIHESSYRRQDKVRFYQEDKNIISNRGSFTTPTEQTFDLLSVYYFSRNIDTSKLKIGDSYKFNYFLGEETSALEIKYLGKEIIKSKLGYVRCFKFSPSIKPGRIFKKDSNLYIWLTDDGNRLLVKAQVDIIVGSVTMEIISAKGLKYPLVNVK